MKARNRAAAISALTLVLVLAGCKTLEETADARERCHELGGEFYSDYDPVFDSYTTACDLSDERNQS